MKINTELIEVVKYTELPKLQLYLSNLLAHSDINGNLGSLTVTELLDFIAPYLVSMGSSSFVPVSGTALPNPVNVSTAFTFVSGPATYTQTTGGNVTTVAPINILGWAGTSWSILSAINIDLSGYITMDMYNTDRFNNLLVPLDVYSAYQTTSRWVPITGVTASWLANSGYFTNGDYYARLSTATTSAVGTVLILTIPKEYRVVGKKFRIYYTYKSTAGGSFKMYFRDEANAAYINNAGSPTSNFVSTIVEKTNFIERTYEAGAAIVYLYLNSFANNSVLEVSNVGFYAKGEPIQAPAAVTVNVDTEINFGVNPAYEANNPWLIGTLAGSSTLQFLDNTGQFTVGKKFVQFSAVGGNATNSFLKLELPNEFKGDNTKSVRIRFAYQATGSGNTQYNIYQRNILDTAWVDNTFAAVTLPKTTKEGFVDITVPIKAGVGFIVLVEQAYSGSVIMIGSVRASILSGVKLNTTSFNNILVVDAAGNGDFTTLRAALRSITDASEKNRYKIIVKNGTYNEMDIAGTNYRGNDLGVVVVEGESREGVIIRTDGNSTALSPSNYNYDAQYSGVPINTIPQVNKHSFYLRESVTFRNLTCHANNVKYCVHQDNSAAPYESLFENCRLIHEETVSTPYYFTVGIGSHGNQRQRYRKCIFESRMSFYNKDVAAVFWHNWNNELAPTFLELTDCESVFGHIAHISELGSGQNDIVTIDRCRTNAPDKGVVYSLTPGFYTPEPATAADYPYSIQLDINDSVINFFDLRAERSAAGYKALALNQYHYPVTNKTAGTLTKGTPVKIDWADQTKSDIMVVSATDNDYGYVLLETLTTGKTGMATTAKKTVYGNAAAATYATNDFVGILNGKFVKVATLALSVGRVLSGGTLATDGLLKILLH